MYQRSEDSRGPEQWTLLDKAFMITYLCGMACGVGLCAFYWAVLYVPEDASATNWIKHGGLYVPMLADLLLSRIPIVSYHFPVGWGWGRVGRRTDG